MKNKSILITLLSLTFIAICCADGIIETGSLTANVTTLVSRSTNQVAGTAITFGDKNPTYVEVTVRAHGHTAATTNGNLVVYIGKTTDGTNYDTGIQPQDSVSLPMTGLTTNQTTKAILVEGCQGIIISGQINSSNGVTTNHTFSYSFKYKR